MLKRQCEKAAVVVALLATPAWIAANLPSNAGFRRAKPPDFSQAKRSDIFFQNAFAEALRGTRPASLGQPTAPPVAGVTSDIPTHEKGDTSRYAWSTIISAATLEDEIKSIKQAVDQTVTTPQKYRDGGFKEGRMQFSMLALLFAIVHDYDGDVRWKTNAAQARDRFAKTGTTSKVGSLDAFRQAEASRTDLDELVRGAGLATSEPAEDNAWDQICERPPLMGRLKIAQNERIATWTANSAAFREHSEEILHEAELVAAIAAAMYQEGFDLSDDDGYVGYCQQLLQTASSLAAAVRGNDAQTARQAAGQMSQACDACHADYR